MFQAIGIGLMAALVVGWLAWQWWIAALDTAWSDPGAATDAPGSVGRAPAFAPAHPRRTTRRANPATASPRTASPFTTNPLRRAFRRAA